MMIISPGRKFVFVHIPKTGGTSMALALEERAHRDDILIGDTPKALKRKGRLEVLRPRGRLWKHSTLADIEGVLAPDEASQLFVFTLVRNPWDRMVSYYHWLGQQRFEHPAVTLAKTLSFDGFVLHDQTYQSFQSSPYESYLQGGFAASQSKHFFRLEHLADDMSPLVQHLGFTPIVPHANKSDRPKDYRNAFSEKTKQAVANMCAKDIQKFDYKFDN